MKKIYCNLIITLFLSCFFSQKDVFSSPRKKVDSFKLVLNLPDLIKIEEVNELPSESKIIKKKKKNIQANMNKDPWPIFINKKLPEKKWPHHIIDEFGNAPIGSVSSFLKLMCGDTYTKKGLIYKAVENGVVFPEGMTDIDSKKLLKNALQHKILDVIFYPSLFIDADIYYRVHTPIYLYDCCIDGKVVFQFFIWRQNIDYKGDDVGLSKEITLEQRAKFYRIEPFVVLLDYIKDKNLYRNEIDRKKLFIKNLSRVRSSVLDHVTPRDNFSRVTEESLNKAILDPNLSANKKHRKSILEYFSSYGNRTPKKELVNKGNISIDGLSLSPR